MEKTADTEKVLTKGDADRIKSGLLDQLMEKPTRYTVDVINATSLPKNLKSKKTIDFVIKPPVLSTLMDVAHIAMEVPEDLSRTMASFSYVEHMARILARLTHGHSDRKMPDWWVKFLMDNCTPKEITMMLQEATLKMGTDFFLPFFQIARQMNPMTMPMIQKRTKTQKDSTPSS